MQIQFSVALSDNPSDPDRPFWIDCDRDFNTGYEEFTEAEADAVCAILNDAGDMLDWDTITADCRWQLVEVQAEIERLRAALKQIADGNPAPPGGKWLSDSKMAMIARAALGGD